MREWINLVENIIESIQGLVYHGSTTSIKNPRKSIEGLFFTPNRKSAEAYARGDEGTRKGYLLIARLHLRKPLVASPEWLEQFEDEHKEAVEQARREVGSSLSLNDAFEDSEDWARELVFAEAHREGYDSVIINKDLLPEEHLSGDWGYYPSYAVFDPACIEVVGGERVHPLS